MPYIPEEKKRAAPSGSTPLHRVMGQGAPASKPALPLPSHHCRRGLPQQSRVSLPAGKWSPTLGAALRPLMSCTWLRSFPASIRLVWVGTIHNPSRGDIGLVIILALCFLLVEIMGTLMRRGSEWEGDGIGKAEEEENGYSQTGTHVLPGVLRQSPESFLSITWPHSGHGSVTLAEFSQSGCK